MRRFALIAAAALVALACGVGASVSDECLQQRRAYQYAYNKQAGLKARGVAADSPAYRLATEELGRARDIVTRCTATEPGGTS